MNGPRRRSRPFVGYFSAFRKISRIGPSWDFASTNSYDSWTIHSSTGVRAANLLAAQHLQFAIAVR